MDLSALLAREGIEASELDALVEWARQRATALISRIEPGSHVAEALGVVLEHVRDANGVPIARQPGRSASRPTGRAVSKPHLGAAVAAALSGKQEDLDLALETVEAPHAERAPEVIEAAPVVRDDPPAPAPDIEPEPDDNDPLIGGFSRFAFSFRRRNAEKLASTAAQEPSQQNLSHGFQIHHAEESAVSGERQRDDLGVPEPPTFRAKISVRRYPGADPNDAEASGLLVLGIPDEEGIDIPIVRSRPRSAGLRSSEPSQPHASSSLSAQISVLDEVPDLHEPARAAVAASDQASEHPMRPVLDDEDSFDLGLDNLEADPAIPTDDDDDDESTAAHGDPGLYEDHPDSAAHASARPHSGPHVRDTGPPLRDSGPHGPPPLPRHHVTASGPEAIRTQPLRSLPPPPPREGKGRGRGKPPPTPSNSSTSSSWATPAKAVKRKKVVDLSQPVARPISAPLPAAPSERSGRRPIPADDEVLASPRRAATPDYLRDDDEE